MTTFIYQHGSYELVRNFHHLLQAFSFLTTKMCNLPGMKSHFLHGKKCKTWDQMGVTVHKNSLENCNLLTKSGFSRKKVDYFDGNLLNKKMVVTKMLTKSRLLTILQVTKSGFHCIKFIPLWGCILYYSFGGGPIVLK